MLTYAKRTSYGTSYCALSSILQRGPDLYTCQCEDADASEWIMVLLFCLRVRAKVSLFSLSSNVSLVLEAKLGSKAVRSGIASEFSEMSPPNE